MINRYKSASLLMALDGWIDYLGELCIEIGTRSRRSSTVSHEIDAIKHFVGCKLAGFLTKINDLDHCTTMTTEFDIPGWLRADNKAPLADFRSASQVEYEFYYTPQQIAAQKDMLKRYG